MIPCIRCGTPVRGLGTPEEEEAELASFMQAFTGSEPPRALVAGLALEAANVCLDCWVKGELRSVPRRDALDALNASRKTRIAGLAQKYATLRSRIKSVVDAQLLPHKERLEKARGAAALAYRDAVEKAKQERDATAAQAEETYHAAAAKVPFASLASLDDWHERLKANIENDHKRLLALLHEGGKPDE